MATLNAIGSNKPIQVSFGGSGDSTLSAHGVLVGEGSSPVTALTPGANGTVLIGATGADPAMALITSTGGTITFTTGANTLNMEAAGSGGVFAWTDVTGTTQTAAVNNGYTANNSSLVTITLPAVAAYGSIVRVVGKGTGLWKIAQNSGQTIHFGVANTTTGATGYIQSTQQYDAIELLCSVANTDWTVINGPQGNITYN